MDDSFVPLQGIVSIEIVEGGHCFTNGAMAQRQIHFSQSHCRWPCPFIRAAVSLRPRHTDTSQARAFKQGYPTRARRRRLFSDDDGGRELLLGKAAQRQAMGY